MPKQRDLYTCNTDEDQTDIPTSGVEIITVTKQRPGEEDLYLQGTLCNGHSDQLSDVLTEQFGLTEVRKADVLGFDQ